MVKWSTPWPSRRACYRPPPPRSPPPPLRAVIIPPQLTQLPLSPHPLPRPPCSSPSASILPPLQLGATRTGRAGRLPPRRSPRAARRIDTARAHAGECGQRERSRMQKILHTRARACERACGEGSFTSGGRTGPRDSFPFIFFPIHIFGVTSSQGPDGSVIRLRKQAIPMKQTRGCRRSSNLFADTADDWR